MCFTLRQSLQGNLSKIFLIIWQIVFDVVMSFISLIFNDKQDKDQTNKVDIDNVEKVLHLNVQSILCIQFVVAFTVNCFKRSYFNNDLIIKYKKQKSKNIEDDAMQIYHWTGNEDFTCLNDAIHEVGKRTYLYNCTLIFQVTCLLN